jgi:phytol kinase
MNNIIATVITFAISLVWLRLMDFFAHRGWIESRLSRKIIHITTGPIFVLCWLMFRDTPEARWLAALVPFGITVQFALVGLGVIKDEAAVQAMSRTGNRLELLRGPLFYGIMFVLMTVLYWKESPIGIISLMLMCGGDGLADLAGRRLKSPGLSWNRQKTLAGSLGFLFGGWIFSMLVLSVYVAIRVFPGPLSGYLIPATLIAIGGTLVESLPFKDIDNITVTTASALLGHLLF